MKKIINTIIYIILVLGVMAFAFMFNPFKAPEPDEKETYLTPQPTTDIQSVDKSIRMALVTDDFVYESWPIMTELYHLSGMKAYYKTIRPDGWQDAIGKILASGDDYDFVELDSYNADIYKSNLLDISTYVEEYAPNYLEWAMTDSKFASDYIYGQPITHFPFREDTNVFYGCAFADASIRGKAVMDIDEFTEFMNGKHIVYKGSTREMVELFAPFFGTSTYWYNEDNQSVYGPTSDQFKIMLKVLNNFYNLGIIPENFEYNPPTEFTESAANNSAGLALSTEDDYEWLHEQGYQPVMLNFSPNAYVPSHPSQPSKMGGIIVGTGKEMDVLKFIDTCFSKEGRALLNYGVDGVHTIAHTDGSIEYLQPYTMGGTYQWKSQGLTPEGLPGIYYNDWAKYDEELLNDLISLRQYLPENDFLVPTTQLQYTSSSPKAITKVRVENLQYEWWTAFIKGEKSVDWDWGEYTSQMNNAGCTQGYLDSPFN